MKVLLKKYAAKKNKGIPDVAHVAFVIRDAMKDCEFMRDDILDIKVLQQI